MPAASHSRTAHSDGAHPVDEKTRSGDTGAGTNGARDGDPGEPWTPAELHAELMVLLSRTQADLADAQIRLRENEDEVKVLRHRLAELADRYLKDTVALRKRAKEAEDWALDAQSRLQEAEQIAQRRMADSLWPDRKFRAAKRAFARLYHPDNIPRGAGDRDARIEVFKAFWEELEKIERG
ncbi:MAG TPA: hypothetical protein VEY95_15845 [Azospirillaceae bacterium]|nr:hypothetical protein [Azospirillaceae bacterium]